jgi:hypothetical protein
MNFSIHLDDSTAALLKREASRRNRTRNAAITEAVKQWLKRSHLSEWPAELLDFKGTPKLKPFEQDRSMKQRVRFP